MSTEILNRTSNEAKIPSSELDVLEEKKPVLNKPKRTCINALNQRLYVENQKDKFKNTAIICVIIFTVGLFGFVLT
tara:strand:- start:164 stop:391 length:228 start_codon:yes stop_codon:yes gene_type:complete